MQSPHNPILIGTDYPVREWNIDLKRPCGCACSVWPMTILSPLLQIMAEPEVMLHAISGSECKVDVGEENSGGGRKGV